MHFKLRLVTAKLMDSWTDLNKINFNFGST